MSDQVGNPENRFSHIEAPVINLSSIIIVEKIEKTIHMKSYGFI